VPGSAVASTVGPLRAVELAAARVSRLVRAPWLPPRRLGGPLTRAAPGEIVAISRVSEARGAPIVLAVPVLGSNRRLNARSLSLGADGSVLRPRMFLLCSHHAAG
jgi:hypothetical protein